MVLPAGQRADRRAQRALRIAERSEDLGVGIGRWAPQDLGWPAVSDLEDAFGSEIVLSSAHRVQRDAVLVLEVAQLGQRAAAELTISDSPAEIFTNIGVLRHDFKTITVRELLTV
jgi:hypothetical protein